LQSDTIVGSQISPTVFIPVAPERQLAAPLAMPHQPQSQPVWHPGLHASPDACPTEQIAGNVNEVQAGFSTDASTLVL